MRTSLSVARDANKDDTGIDGLELLVAKSPFFQCSRAKVLEHDVAFFYQSKKELTAFFEIEGDEPFIARLNWPQQRVIAIALGPPYTCLLYTSPSPRDRT